MRQKATSSHHARASLRARAIEEGYRSGLEERIAADLDEAGVAAEFESVTVRYEQPAKPRRYTPDFPLPNGILIETKGRFVTADRQKHKMIKACHPDLDIRFVFSNPNARISKTSKTTYAKWCEQYGFKYAKGSIPQEWIDEPTCGKRIAAIGAASV